MPNVAFHQEVLKKVVAGPSTFAGLGAVGPDMYQYQPVSADLIKQVLDPVFQKVLGGAPVPNPLTTDVALSAELNDKPLMAAYALLFKEIVQPFWPALAREAFVLGKLQDIAKNSDNNGLKALLNLFSNQLDKELNNDAALLLKLPPAAAALTAIMPQIVQVAPPIQRSAPAKPWDPTESRTFEFLRWHRTDKFAVNLLKTAANGNQKAYAQGYLCHMASAVCGEPFVNNIAGGPYRTHWWRNRFVANFVDTWTFGRYETPGASMTGDNPNPNPLTDGYFKWSDIRVSNLWKNIDVSNLNPPAGTPPLFNLPGFIDAIAAGNVGVQALLVPGDVANLLTKTIVETWLLPANRPAGFKHIADIDKSTRESCVGLFSVVWFMTSGFGPMGPFGVVNAAPSSCTSPPSWVTSGGSPPSPQSNGPSTGATVCGVILAILALLLFIFQQWAAGAAAVAGAIAAFASGGGIDFDKLACDVHWLLVTLRSAEDALVNALVLAGLAYPGPDKLGSNDGSGNWTPASGKFLGITPDTTPLTRTNFGANSSASAFVPIYPLQMDNTSPFGPADNHFGAFPPAVLENVATMNLSPSANIPIGYADMVLDGSPPEVPGVQNFGMVHASPFPSRNAPFGDAVANAQAVIKANAADMPNYNLDADRGYGWITWDVEPNTFPNSGTVHVVPEP